MRSAPARRSDRMMMLMPSRTAASARAHSRSSASFMPVGALLGRVGDVEVRDLNWLSPTSRIERIFSRSSLVRIGWRTSSRLRRDEPFEVEQVRPRPDERDEAHHQLLADRIDRRVGHLREVLLEIGVEQLRLVRQRRDRRVVAHRADRFLAGRRHRRHQDLAGLPGCSRSLLAIEQRQVGRAACRRPAGRSSSTICVRVSHFP